MEGEQDSAAGVAAGARVATRRNRHGCGRSLKRHVVVDRTTNRYAGDLTRKDGFTKASVVTLVGTMWRRWERVRSGPLGRWCPAIAVLTILLALGACRVGNDTQRSPIGKGAPVLPASRDARQHRAVASGEAQAASVGFHSRRQLSEHFAKHGADFSPMTAQEYLHAAQALRDAPVGGAIEEIRRADGTMSRFDRETGAFIAFDADGTIRTFFKPNNGEAYFRRQAQRLH
jgi:hypothetical protein